MANLDKDYYLDKSGLNTLVNELEKNIVAEEYSSSVTYNLGDYCIHDNKFYRCTTAIPTAESWTSGHWVQVIIGDELGEVVSNMADTSEANALNHLGFYLDSNGGLCQVNSI